MYAELYSVVDDLPASLLATSDAIALSTLSSSAYALVTFSFTGANRVLLSASTNYFIVFKFAGGGPSIYALIGVDQTSPSHDGFYAYSYDGAAWESGTDLDCIFYVYGELINVGEDPSMTRGNFLIMFS